MIQHSKYFTSFEKFAFVKLQVHILILGTVYVDRHSSSLGRGGGGEGGVQTNKWVIVSQNVQLVVCVLFGTLLRCFVT